MSSSDHRKPRKVDFPQCAVEALSKIGKQNENSIFWIFFHMVGLTFPEALCTSKKNQDRCLEIVAESIFLEKRSDPKKTTIIGLNVFQEFQLVLALAEFFSRPGPDVTRNAVFLSLFGVTTLSPGRSRVLSKFVSTAISDSIAPVSSLFPIYHYTSD